MRGKWTEGQWSVEQNSAGAWDVVAGEPGSYAPVIAQTWSGHGNFDMRANARLIAAAPALYEALEAVTRSTEWSCMEADIQDAVLAALSLAHTEPSQGEK